VDLLPELLPELLSEVLPEALMLPKMMRPHLQLALRPRPPIPPKLWHCCEPPTAVQPAAKTLPEVQAPQEMCKVWPPHLPPATQPSPAWQPPRSPCN